MRRTTGTAPDEMTSASTWPEPTEGSWSKSPTIKEGSPVRHRLHERLHQQDIAMEVSNKGTLDAVTVSARLLFASSTTLCSTGAALNIHNPALALKICCAVVCTGQLQSSRRRL